MLLLFCTEFVVTQVTGHTPMATASTSKTESSLVEDDEHCIICLQDITDRALLPACGHKYTCFQCIWAWITSGSEVAKSRRCPLCNTPVGEYLIHNMRGEHDFERYWIPPPVAEAVALSGLARSSRTFGRQTTSNPTRARFRRQVVWGKRRAGRFGENDELERAIEKRRHIYRNNLYAKVSGTVSSPDSYSRASC